MKPGKELGVIFVSGPPGAGKTTMSRDYQKFHSGIEQFSVGDLVRAIGYGYKDSSHRDAVHRARDMGKPLADNIFSDIVHEELTKSDDNTNMSIITGFPYGRGDWELFRERGENSNIRMLGAIALHASIFTCTERMILRDLSSGRMAENAEAYKQRYSTNLAISETRLSLYALSGLEIVSVSAEDKRDQVFSKFSRAIDKLTKKE